MTREEAWNEIDAIIGKHEIDDEYVTITREQGYEALRVAREALEQQTEDAISRQAVLDVIEKWLECSDYNGAERHIMRAVQSVLYDSPSVTLQPKTGHCKDCKYFEYNSMAIVDGGPLIVAHEICKKWSGGCKTSEDGYCFLFEPQGSEK